MTRLTRREAGLACLGLLAAASGARAATDFPVKPVTLVVPFAAGGGSDTTARTLARFFQDITGQPMLVENRPGGGTLVALNYLKGQKPDGYTLGMMTRAQHVTYWREGGKVPVHPLEDIAFVSATHGSIFGMVVKADSPFNSLDDLVRHAKAHPGKLSFGNIGTGTTHNLVALEFARLAGIDVLHAAFKGEAESNTAVMGGHIDVGVSSGIFIPQVTGGRLKLLGLALEQRLPEFPEWRTFKEQGYDVQMDTSVGIGGPKGMPEDTVRALDAVFRKMTSDPQFVAALMKQYQPVQYLQTAAYRKAQQAQFLKEQALVRQYKLDAR